MWLSGSHHRRAGTSAAVGQGLPAFTCHRALGPTYLDGAESREQSRGGRLPPGVHHGCQPAVLRILPSPGK